MATQRITPRTQSYGPIDRGTSLTIPVSLKDTEDNPIDLTGYNISFTIKKVSYDFDSKDDRAYVQKDFAPQDPVNGKFSIQLSSMDLDFEPAKFYFDIELTHQDGAVFRIANLEFDLVGGPTNRTTNAGLGQLPIGDEINIILLGVGRPVTIIAPMLRDSLVAAELSNLVAEVNQIKRVLKHHDIDISDLLALTTNYQFQIFGP